MKILIIHGQTFEFDDAEKSMLGLKNLLEKEGYEVKFFSYFTNENSKILYYSKIRKIFSIFYFPIIFRNLIKEVLKNDRIVVSITGNIVCAPSIWSGLILSKLFNKKCIAYIHEPLLPFWGLSKFGNILLMPIRWLDILIFKLFKPKTIICNSEFTKKFTKLNYKIKDEI